MYIFEIVDERKVKNIHFIDFMKNQNIISKTKLQSNKNMKIFRTPDKLG